MDQKAYSELSLRELRVLDALLQLRSITRTAEAMETTQRHVRVVRPVGPIIGAAFTPSRDAATRGRFQAKACPGLDPGWRPVRVKKTRRIKNPVPGITNFYCGPSFETAASRPPQDEV